MGEKAWDSATVIDILTMHESGYVNVTDQLMIFEHEAHEGSLTMIILLTTNECIRPRYCDHLIINEL